MKLKCKVGRQLLLIHPLATAMRTRTHLNMFRGDAKHAIVPLLTFLPVVNGISQAETLWVHHPQTSDIRADEFKLFKVQGVRVQRGYYITLGDKWTLESGSGRGDGIFIYLVIL